MLSELMIALAVLFIVLGGLAVNQANMAETGRAQVSAAVLQQLHRGAESYVRSEYTAIEDCLDGIDQQAYWATLSTGGQVGSFRAVPLFPLSGLGWPGVNHSQGLGDRSCIDIDPSTGAASASTAPLLSIVADTGFLPAALSALSYDNAVGSESNLWRGIDFRLIVRLVNFNPNVGLPEMGVQGFLVARSPPGEAMSIAESSAVVRNARIPQIGLLQSWSVGDVEADRTIAGVGGGWRATLCSSTVTVGGLASCPGAAAMRVIDVSSDSSPELLAFLARPIGTHRVSGTTGPTDEIPAARVVTTLTMARDTYLSDFLARKDIGLPEANRMETELDLGGYGALNVSYVTGVDTDGDAVVDEGTIMVGPAYQSALPTRIHGDLHVTGALQVGGDTFGTGIDRGDVLAQRALHVGGDVFDVDVPEGAALIEGEVRTSGGLRASGPQVVLLSDATLAAGRSWANIALGSGAGSGPGTMDILAAPGNILMEAGDALTARSEVGDLTLEAQGVGQIKFDANDAFLSDTGPNKDRLLSDALPRYVSRPTDFIVYDENAGASGCPTGSSQKDFVVPTAWARSKAAAERVIILNNPDGTEAGRFTLYDPYYGWSVDPLTGVDNASGGQTAVKRTNYSLLVFCDYRELP